MPIQPDYETASEPKSDRKYFSVAEANRALPYVRRIVEDVRQTYREAVALQERVERPMPGEDADTLQDQYAASIDQLNHFVDELHQVGVELKDYDLGLIDFPALHEGREVCLCWRRGEDTIVAWHETAAGFAGRQDLTLLHPTKL
ncbi:MAG: DUF2203 family protein [Planctomycetes bacterium]|nr:DUF2203 family protein [Planctomycetota bacterium]